MKVAIVHDWFVGWGAEAVVYELHKMYPQAPIYTSYCNDEWRARLGPKMVRTGYLQGWPFSKLRKFIPFLRALWFSRLDLSGFDLVISSSGAEAKAVRVKAPTVHINYCHAPTHYYWSRYNEYMKEPGFGFLNPLARVGLKILVSPMRRWDKRAAARPDYMIANSNYTKNEIKRYYGRNAVVIHPPVDIQVFAPKAELKRKGFLVAGRQTPYKRFDLAVQACSRLNLPLKVVGHGPDHKRLRRLAGPSVEFFPAPKTTAEMAEHMRSAEAFIFPGVDDFGIIAVEALASGTPVIAYNQGGALDYVTLQTGLLFGSQTSEALAETLQQFDPSAYSHSDVSAAAKKFSPGSFRSKIEKFIKEVTG